MISPRRGECGWTRLPNACLDEKDGSKLPNRPTITISLSPGNVDVTTRNWQRGVASNLHTPNHCCFTRGSCDCGFSSAFDFSPLGLCFTSVSMCVLCFSSTSLATPSSQNLLSFLATPPPRSSCTTLCKSLPRIFLISC